MPNTGRIEAGAAASGNAPFAPAAAARTSATLAGMVRARVGVLALFLAIPVLLPAQGGGEGEHARRPSILFAMADDWGWPHAGALGDRVVATPTFDRLAREGVLFDHAWVSSQSCTPSRSRPIRPVAVHNAPIVSVSPLVPVTATRLPAGSNSSGTTCW